jgi:ribosome-binding protein aMBF1 (putative translation factor)
MSKNRKNSAREILHRRVYEGREDRIVEREQTRREMTLGDKIRRYREEAGYTQQQLAKRIGTQASAISRIEDADYDRHSISLLERVAKALDMLLLIDFAPKHPKRTGSDARDM